MKFNQLPDVLYPLILAYLERTDAVNLASSTSAFYKLLMKDYARWITLSTSGSLYDFLHNQEFRARLFSKVRNCSQQLSLRLQDSVFRHHLNMSNSSRSFFFPIKDIKMLKVSFSLLVMGSEIDRFGLLDCFEMIRELVIDFGSNNYSAVNEFLDKIIHKNLETDAIQHLQLYDLQRKINMFPYIRGLKYLKLCNIGGALVLDPQYGDQLKKVVIDSCYGLEDVTMLGNVPIIDIKYCQKLFDISALKNNHKVSIIRCWNILDFTHSFHTAIEITISGCNPAAMIDIQTFQKVQKFILHRSNLLPLNDQLPKSLKFLEFETSSQLPFLVGFLSQSNISLRSLQRIKLSQCTNISSISALHDIPVIYLDHLDNLTSLDGIQGGRTHLIDIGHCAAITAFRPLRDIHTVRVRYCDGFSSFKAFVNVKDLTIIGCPKVVTDISVLDKVEHLTIGDCPGIDSLAGLKPLLSINLPNFEAALKYLNSLSVAKKVVIHNTSQTDLRKVFPFPKIRAYYNVDIDDKNGKVYFFRE